MTGRWFSLHTPVSSTNKTDHHDITEILLKVLLNTIDQTRMLFDIFKELLPFFSENISSRSLYVELLLHFICVFLKTLHICLLPYEEVHIFTEQFLTIFEGVIALFYLEFSIVSLVRANSPTF